MSELSSLEEESTSFATIASFLPYDIEEDKPGLIPRSFKIKGSKKVGDFEVTIIGDAFHYVYLDSDRGHFPASDPSLKVARSIVHDYIQCQLARETNAEPGLIAFPGKWSKEETRTKFEEQL